MFGLLLLSCSVICLAKIKKHFNSVIPRSSLIIYELNALLGTCKYHERGVESIFPQDFLCIFDNVFDLIQPF